MTNRIIKDRDEIIYNGYRLREKKEDGIAVDVLLVCMDDQYRYQDCSQIMFDDNGDNDEIEDAGYLVGEMYDWVYAQGEWEYRKGCYDKPLLDAMPDQRYGGWLYVVEGEGDDEDRYFWTEKEARDYLAQRKAQRQEHDQEYWRRISKTLRRILADA